MVTFLLSALAFYAIRALQERFPRFHWLANIPIFLGWVLLVAFEAQLIADPGWHAPDFETTASILQRLQTVLRRLSVAEGTIHGLFGAIAGGVIWSLSRWVADAYVEADVLKWRMIGFAGVVSGILLAALFAPYIPGWLGRLHVFDTPVVKFELETANSGRPVAAAIDQIQHREPAELIFSLKIPQLDCAYSALIPDNAYPSTSIFESALTIRHLLNEYVNPLSQRSRREPADRHLISESVRLVADRLMRMLSHPYVMRSGQGGDIEAVKKDFGDAYRALREEVEWQERGRPEAAEQLVDWAPSGCKPGREWPDDESAANVIRQTYYLHSLAEGLYDFAGDFAASLHAMRLARAVQPGGKDQNVSAQLAAELRVSGNDFAEIYRLMNEALNFAQHRKDALEGFTPPNDSDKEWKIKAKKELLRRYERAILYHKLDLAYWEAQDPLPDQVDWTEVRDYVAKNYNRDVLYVKEGECGDKMSAVEIPDVYAFVRLQYERWQYVDHRDPPKRASVSEARAILVDARAAIDQANERKDRDGFPCVSEAVARSWKIRIKQHLDLADSLLDIAAP
jgi:hypothetical protein